MIDFDNIPLGSTYDDNGNILTCKYSDGFSCVRTYDDKGNELTFKYFDGCF